MVPRFFFNDGTKLNAQVIIEDLHIVDQAYGTLVQNISLTLFLKRNATLICPFSLVVQSTGVKG